MYRKTKEEKSAEYLCNKYLHIYNVHTIHKNINELKNIFVFIIKRK